MKKVFLYCLYFTVEEPEEQISVATEIQIPAL